MSIRLRNTWALRGDDWWEWAAFVDDDGTGELEDVAFVEYVLHETFPRPIRRIKTRRGGFRFQTEGWGTFDLKAFVHMKNGRKIRLEHKIQLEYDPKEGMSA